MYIRPIITAAGRHAVFMYMYNPSPKVTKVVTVTLKSYGTLWSDINSIIPILDLPLHMYNHDCNQISLQLVTYDIIVFFLQIHPGALDESK